jgi:hypothetical protein
MNSLENAFLNILDDYHEQVDEDDSPVNHEVSINLENIQLNNEFTLERES